MHLVDEAGAPVESASLRLIGRSAPIRVRGSAELMIDQPVAGVVSAVGFLDEPVVLQPDDTEVTVELLAALGPGGVQRRVLQFGGDMMMGRRYQSGVTEGAATATTPEEARAVVASVAPLMAAADASMVNLETVVGELSPLDAYPGKRFLLQSPPLILDALDELGIDLVTLGNNHAYDWREEGVASTIAQLDGAGIAWAGAGVDAAQAEAGRMLDVNGMKVGVVSATTVNGDFVNDNLPRAEEAAPADLSANEEWQYEERAFGFGKPADAAYLAPANRRAGDTWQQFRRLERTLTDADAAALWSAISRVYPELQDWVARRGHGGAAPFRTDVVTAQVQALRAQGAALVVVQLHGGFQFSEVPSDFLRAAAHSAIDAGADLVVGHHPHVLQGFEWYEGHLIAYSLGNFVFDQDFLSTFPSAILRTVFEGDTLLQARVVPLLVEGYRPVPASGEAAARVLRQMTVRSLAPALSERLQPDLVGNVVTPSVSGNAVVRADGASALVLSDPLPSTDSLALVGGIPRELDACTTLRAAAGSETQAAIGTDLLGWGTFDDFTADGSDQGAQFWTLDPSASLRYSAGRGTYVHLESDAHTGSSTRQVARSAIPEHRWFDADGQPLDGSPRYTLQLDALRSDEGASVRVVLYDVNDTDPTVEPTSVTLHEATIPLPLATKGEWHTLTVDLTDVFNVEFDGVRADAVLVYIVAPAGDDRLDIDDVRLFEWRPAADMPEAAWAAADALMVPNDADASFDVFGCP